jgi:hypothetical protein
MSTFTPSNQNNQQNKNMTELKELLEQWRARIESDCDKVDMEAMYSDMLDECYSFESVGGPFVYMSPSKVLESMDSTAFRCGLNDYADSMRDEYVELSNGHYRVEDCGLVKDEIVDEWEAEIEAERESEENEDADALQAILDEFKRKDTSDL